MYRQKLIWLLCLERLLQTNRKKKLAYRSSSTHSSLHFGSQDSFPISKLLFHTLGWYKVFICCLLLVFFSFVSLLKNSSSVLPKTYILFPFYPCFYFGKALDGKGRTGGRTEGEKNGTVVFISRRRLAIIEESAGVRPRCLRT